MAENKKQIVLNCEKLETRFALLNDGRLEEYHIERAGEEIKPGSIYLGKIVNLEPSLQAAFLDIGAERNAFLHYHDMLPAADEREKAEQAEEISSKHREHAERKGKSAEIQAQETRRRKKKLTVEDIPNVFRPGMEILVQVVKSPISTKGARVTTNISIPGRYLVLLPYSAHIGLSTKIENTQERSRLRKILSELEVPEGIGLICRTVGEGRKSAYFKRDLDWLLDAWRSIEETIDKNKAPLCAYAEPTLLKRTARDFMTEDIDGIVIDDKDSYKEICGILKKLGCSRMASKVKLYDKPTPIYDQYQIDRQLDEVYRREVKLPSGGYICIDETEALIAIDVNSGKGGRKAPDQPEFILQTNREAVTEIARQLRLRDIGGLVVLDLIDMKSQCDRDEICRLMKKLVKEDRAKTKVLPISRLGLMEMTRQREHESLQDTVYDRCPYCCGSGRVKSAETMSVEIQRRLHSLMRDKRYKKIPLRVIMHPEVLSRLKNEDAGHLQEIEEKYQNSLSFRADEMLHCEEFRIVDPETNQEIF